MKGGFGTNCAVFSYQPKLSLDLSDSMKALCNIPDIVHEGSFYLLSASGKGGDRHCGANVKLSSGSLHSLFEIGKEDFTLDFLGEEHREEDDFFLTGGSEPLKAETFLLGFRKLLQKYGGTLTISKNIEGSSSYLVFSDNVPQFSLKYYYGELELKLE